MKRLFLVLVLVAISGYSFGLSVIYEDKRNFNLTIAIDSTGDSSAGGLITVVDDTIVMEQSGVPIKSLIGALIVEPSLEVAHGFGLADSAFMALQTFGLGYAPVTLASRGQLLLPGTLFVDLVNVGDTLFKRHLRWVIQVLDTSAADSLVDSVTTANNGRVIRPYNLRWELIGRD